MTDDRTRPIAALLGRLDGKPRARLGMCGGALLRVARDTVQAYARLYDVDFAEPLELPEDGSPGDARVVCDQPVLEARGVGGGLVQLATCARCASIEARERGRLAEVAARAEGGR